MNDVRTAHTTGSQALGEFLRRSSDTGASSMSANVVPSDTDMRGYASALGRADLDDLVERVIDRIEQRVVDELERRGRRQNPGVF